MSASPVRLAPPEVVPRICSDLMPYRKKWHGPAREIGPRRMLELMNEFVAVNAAMNNASNVARRNAIA